MTQINLDPRAEPTLAVRDARSRGMSNVARNHAGEPDCSRGPLAGALAAHYIAEAMPNRPPRRLFEASAALIGIAAGVLFAEPVLAAAASAWHGFFLPAYDELIKNGLLAWCM
jgi:hypothetical protein